MLRGDDQRMYFKMICFDMRQIEQNQFEKRSSQAPQEDPALLSMMMLICIMIIYLVVLCTEVMSSLGAFFG